MFIKICANTNLADAQLAAELGADAVGFVFAPSKRQVTVEQVAAITRRLPSGVLTVGVFATRDADEIAGAALGAALQAVQLHRAPDAALIRQLNEAFEGGVQIIQTVPYVIDAADRRSADAELESLLGVALTIPAISAVLLDAARGGVSGGLGVRFDWRHGAAVVREAYAQASGGSHDLPKLMIAGGLTAENVEEAVAILQPWGVDVASGVESEPGKKDPERLRAFMAAAREGKTSS